jgi:hypothetical protein
MQRLLAAAVELFQLLLGSERASVQFKVKLAPPDRQFTCAIASNSLMQGIKKLVRASKDDLSETVNVSSDTQPPYHVVRRAPSAVPMPVKKQHIGSCGRGLVASAARHYVGYARVAVVSVCKARVSRCVGSYKVSEPKQHP